MGILGRKTLREITGSALLGVLLFTFVVFLDRVRPLFELLVRASAPASTVGYLFALILPSALTFTIPVGVLVGVLLTMSRMSGDAEITAMRAGGLPGRRVLPPVVVFGLLGLVLTAAASLWLTPFSIRQRYKVINRLAAAQLTAEIQPRVFEEQFPNTILYVGDVIPGKIVRWKDVFLADITPPDKRRQAAHEAAGEGPKLTVAAEAIAVPDAAKNQIQLELLRATTHVVGQQPSDYYSSMAPRMQQVLQAERPQERRPRLVFTEMDTVPLLRAIGTLSGRDRTDALIELHQRLSLPLACLLLAVVGVPLGVSTRKGGKSSAFVLTVVIAFLYYMALISLIGLAREGRLPPGPAVWMPNIVLLVCGLVALLRMESPGDRDPIGAVRAWIVESYKNVQGKLPAAFRFAPRPRETRSALAMLPQLVDTYVLGSFLYYFALLLISFVALTHVFTFFDLLGDMVKNRIPMWLMVKYLFFLTPQLIYVLTPTSVLVAVLVTFGVLSKNNEVTAMKACGVSLYRLSVPVLLVSTLFSGMLFAFDYTYIPKANVIQDAIRDQIKGRPPQTYLRPDRRWIFGRSSRIYYYKYFDQNDSAMLGVNVYEFTQNPFRMTRLISAEKARWEPTLNTWIFQNGWARALNGGGERYQAFEGSTATFRELDEPPSYFLKEVKQDKQMNPPELAGYIGELQQSGFDTVRLQIQLHKKFAAPLFALVMALISVPFAFLVGTRGAMAGIGISFSIAVAYWAVNQIFEQIGNVNQLPPQLAAWSPDALFALCGLYLLARMRT